MLSVFRCRRLVGKCSDCSDTELERIRDALYGFAFAAMRQFEESKALKAPAAVVPFPTVSDGHLLLADGNRFKIKWFYSVIL